MSAKRPRHPNEIAAAEAARALVATSEAELQALYLKHAYSPGERAVMIKALLAYAGMVPLEPGVRVIAEGLARKIEGCDD